MQAGAGGGEGGGNSGSGNDDGIFGFGRGARIFLNLGRSIVPQPHFHIAAARYMLSLFFPRISKGVCLL